MITIKLDLQHRELVKKFSCGNMILDNFLKSQQSFDSGIGVTYIYLTEDQNRVVGYYNISAGCVDYLDNGLRLRDAGAIHLNYFAVDLAFQKKNNNMGISDLLLEDCVQRVHVIRENILGFNYITLDSTQEALGLYQRHGFQKIELDEGIIFSPYKNEYTSIPMYLFLDEA